MDCCFCKDKRKYPLSDILRHPGWCPGTREAAAAQAAAAAQHQAAVREAAAARLALADDDRARQEGHRAGFRAAERAARLAAVAQSTVNVRKVAEA